jgi:hypothetical protein
VAPVPLFCATMWLVSWLPAICHEYVTYCMFLVYVVLYITVRTYAVVAHVTGLRTFHGVGSVIYYGTMSYCLV